MDQSVSMAASQLQVALPTTLGARIRARRYELKLSQEAVARPDFTKSYVSAVERDKVRPSLKALRIMALKLQTTATELLADDKATDPALKLDQAEAALLAGQHKLAQTFLEAPVAGHEARQELLRAKAQLAAGWWTGALESVDKALVLEPKSPEALHLSTIITAQGGQLRRAVDQHQQLIGSANIPGSDLPVALRPTVLRHLLEELAATGDTVALNELWPKLDLTVRSLVARIATEYARDSLTAFEDGDAEAGLTALAQAQAVERVGAEMALAAQIRLVWVNSVSPIPNADNTPGAVEEGLQEARLLALLSGENGMAGDALLEQAIRAKQAGNTSKALALAEKALYAGLSTKSSVRSNLLRARIWEERDEREKADRLFEAALKQAMELSSDIALRVEVAGVYGEVLAARGEHERSNRVYRIGMGRAPIETLTAAALSVAVGSAVAS